MSERLYDQRIKENATSSTEYTIREQRRWNMECTQSIWGPSSPSTSPERNDTYEQNNEEEKEKHSSEKRKHVSRHHRHKSRDYSHEHSRSRSRSSSHHSSHHSINTENRVSITSDQSSDDEACGPSIEDYQSILEQKHREELEKELAEKQKHHELQAWELRRIRKQKMRIAAYKASFTPKP